MYNEMVRVYKEATGSTVPTTWSILARLMLWMSKDLANMFRFFEQDEYYADIVMVRKMHPTMKDLGMWLREKSKN